MAIYFGQLHISAKLIIADYNDVVSDITIPLSFSHRNSIHFPREHLQFGKGVEDIWQFIFCQLQILRNES